MEARLSVGRVPNALVVHSDALTRIGASWVVFQVVAGKARRVEVRVLGEDDHRVAVSGKLTVGSQVVVVGNEALFPNAPVRVANPRQKSQPAGASAGSPRPAAATR